MSFVPKIGIIACSGECCTGGNIARYSALRVMHKLRPRDTLTICLPLFLAGDSGERGFAEVFPTITIDGCHKMCAAKGTTKYSSEPSVKINVEDYIHDECQETRERWKIEAHKDIVNRIAEDVAKHVDILRAKAKEEWT